MDVLSSSIEKTNVSTQPIVALAQEASSDQSRLDPYKQKIIDFHTSQSMLRSPNTKFKTSHVDFAKGKTNMQVYNAINHHIKTQNDLNLFNFSQDKYVRHYLKEKPAFSFPGTIKPSDVDFSAMDALDKKIKEIDEKIKAINNQYSKELKHILANLKGYQGEDTLIALRYKKQDMINALLKEKDDFTINQAIKNQKNLPQKQKLIDPDKPYAYEMNEIVYKTVQEDSRSGVYNYDPITGKYAKISLKSRQDGARAEFKNKYLLTNEFAKTKEFEQDFARYYEDMLNSAISWKDDANAHGLKNFVISAGNTQAQWIDYAQTQIQTLQGYIKNERFTQEGQEFFAKSKELYENILQDLRNI